MWFLNRSRSVKKSAIAVHFCTHFALINKCRSVSFFNTIIKIFIHTGENFQILRKFSNFGCRKNCYLNLRAPKIFCMQLISEVSFFTRRICALVSLEWQIFLLVKKSITLLTCCINNYLIISM
jgi:hypothetical protein